MESRVLVILMVFGLSSFSQSASLLPQVNGSWEVTYWFGYPQTMYSDYSFYTDSSTFYHNDTLWNFNSHGLHYSEAGKVYFKAWPGEFLPYSIYNDTLTHLIYNYNLNVGDTAYLYEEHGFPVIVDSIGISDFLGQTRTALFLKAFSSIYDIWIVGMGSVHGFFYPWAHTFEGGHSMCFFQGNYLDSLNSPYTLSYDNPNICESLAEEKFELESIKMNCSGSKITVEVNKAEDLIIYSYTGQEIQRFSLQTGLNELDISTLKSGAYIVKIGGSYTERFIKS